MPTPAPTQLPSPRSTWRHHADGEYEIIGTGWIEPAGQAVVVCRRVIRGADDELSVHALSDFMGLTEGGGSLV
jgi:hypothetical protein